MCVALCKLLILTTTVQQYETSSSNTSESTLSIPGNRTHDDLPPPFLIDESSSDCVQCSNCEFERQVEWLKNRIKDDTSYIGILRWQIEQQTKVLQAARDTIDVLEERISEIEDANSSRKKSKSALVPMKMQPQNNPNYKVSMCRTFERGHKCAFGDSCAFSHGADDHITTRSRSESNSPRPSSSGIIKKFRFDCDITMADLAKVKRTHEEERMLKGLPN